MLLILKMMKDSMFKGKNTMYKVLELNKCTITCDNLILILLITEYN